jgi:serine/threonine-protein kinase
VTATDDLPRKFGGYTLFDFIGKGGMAEIFLARQKTELGATRLCVVKQILPALARDTRFSDMLIHEAKLAAKLNHTNVVQVLDLGRGEQGRLFIAMEYVEGFDLNELLKRCSRAEVPLPFELGMHVVREALRGLDYAHRCRSDDDRPLGIVHRDVSPSNLLISFEGEVKVCDFGIARANEQVSVGTDASAHELAEALRGKAGYMSPEHARGEATDARSDVFAAGIVLWELAAGKRMYRTGEGLPTLLEQARAAGVPALPDHDLPMRDRLCSILDRALAEHREDRYPSAAAMLRNLEDYAARAKLTASPLQLGEWLVRTFGEDILSRRRSRERAVAALEKGAPLTVRVVEPVPKALSPSKPAPARKRSARALTLTATLALALVALAAAVAAVLQK